MLGVSAPGSTVYVSESSNPARKLRYTLEAIRVRGRWVGIHPARANAVVEEALLENRIPALAGFSSLRREPPHHDRGRCDFLLEHTVPTWVEVKYVTLAEDGRALFPDSVSVRATRHVRTLKSLAGSGNRAVVLFVSPRSDVRVVSPADAIDPVFGDALREAVDGGVEVLAYRMAVSRRSIRLAEPIPVALSREDAERLRVAPQP